jgi:hypothetical protein
VGRLDGTSDGSSGLTDAVVIETDAAESVDAADAGAGDLGLAFTATLLDTRFHVAEHMRASIEMQLSGEPFAQLLGYNLRGFDRQLTETDLYNDPKTGMARVDPLGYALAIESYEYSKQPMNNLSFESGAGLSLMFGPVLNSSSAVGQPAFQLLVDRFQRFALESNAGGPGSMDLVVSPAPTMNPLNYYGWPGLWPVMAEFSSFDPAIHPSAGSVQTCTLGGAFTYGMNLVRFISNYECDYNSLNLLDRNAQVTKTLDLAALGYVVWKQGLWTINYWGSLHDLMGNGTTVVSNPDLAAVGQPGNSVVGQYPDPNDPTGMHLLTGVSGTYLGDTFIEGWQGLLMMEEIDNKAGLLLGSLISADGAGLQAISIRQAIDYGYDSPLRFFPAEISVQETATATTAELANKYFPRPSSFQIAAPASRLRTLSGLIGGYAEAFAFTDRNNAAIGGSIPFLATFDGDPFPMDNGLPDGEHTLHDRALGVLKVAIVDLDRLHFDPSSKVLVDTASVSGGVIERGTHVSTVELAEAILALRNAYRSLSGSLQLYSNDTPDTLGALGALDMAPISGAPFMGTLSAHLIDLIRSEASFLSTKIIDASGKVAIGFDLARNEADPRATTLEAEAGAIRALLEAYLATGDETYRQRSIAVYTDLSARFWLPDARCYRAIASVDDPLRFTPLRFGLLQGALRQYFKLVASRPGREAEATELLARVKRTMKLIVNGWDDRNQDDMIQYPAECTGAGLEMAERALTGELGHPRDFGDRDSDCVKEISIRRLPAALGAELELTRR